MTLVSAVSAPAITKPKHNLVSSGHLVPISTDKWEGGVSFTPRGCYQIEGACATCPPQSKEEMQECVEAAEFMPYMLDLGISLYAPDREAVNAFAEDDLDVGSSSRLESLIWSGCGDVDNPLLSDGTSLGANLTPILALGKMSAELISERWGITRGDCDRIGLRSQQRAARASAFTTPRTVSKSTPKTPSASACSKTTGSKSKAAATPSACARR